MEEGDQCIRQHAFTSKDTSGDMPEDSGETSSSETSEGEVQLKNENVRRKIRRKIKKQTQKVASLFNNEVMPIGEGQLSLNNCRNWSGNFYPWSGLWNRTVLLTGPVGSHAMV